MRYDPSSAAEGQQRAGTGGCRARPTGNGPPNRYQRDFKQTVRVEELNTRYNCFCFVFLCCFVDRGMEEILTEAHTDTGETTDIGDVHPGADGGRCGVWRAG